MSRPKNKEEIILLAAINIFMDKGFANTSVQDIATCAGIAKGTIYDYFKNKDELFIQSLKFQADQLEQIVLKTVSKQDGFINKVNNMLDFAMRSEVKEHIKWMHLFFFNDFIGLNQQSKIEFQLFLDNMRNNAIGIWHDILTNGVKEGKIRVIDMEFASTCVFSLISAYNHHMSELNDIEYDQEKAMMFDFIMNGIGYK